MELQNALIIAGVVLLLLLVAMDGEAAKLGFGTRGRLGDATPTKADGTAAAGAYTAAAGGGGGAAAGDDGRDVLAALGRRECDVLGAVQLADQHADE